ncbi:lipoyl synthase [Halodesulfurarchaeum sp. HSR-GB]|uniref:lipoyl synthase n=1 Tax=Halodesulfurarchaeum sp. HSR-GB TaxID=3074077 RepID=UPI0037BE6AF7
MRARKSRAMAQRKPAWLRAELSGVDRQHHAVHETVADRDLNTVCEGASCPNREECWSQERTASFMILGDTCTRDCSFCDVPTGSPSPPDPTEPDRLAGAVEDLDLSYVVLTSVDRDDLPDGGAEHFADCIRAVRERNPETTIEVLIPDFMGSTDALRTIVRAGPDVIGHNLETVRRLQGELRDPRAAYYQSLSVLEGVKKLDETIFTKSALMVGFGETEAEVTDAMDDLRGAAVDLLTIGQYLRPSADHPEVQEYVPPEQFEAYREYGEAQGFEYVAAAPTVRSSYRAGELWVENALDDGVEPDRL